MQNTKQFNLRRIEKLIRTAIKIFELNLKDLIVLTEAASGYYAFTPIIAACAGAKQVIAITRSSKYGSIETIRQDTLNIADSFGVKSRIIITDHRYHPLIGNADIVTNLGFVRPLDKEMLSLLKETAVIPLMWETWEFRSSDLDLEAAREKEICVLGTNEHHHLLKTFDYIGHLALKMLYESEIEVFGSSIVILGCGEFAAITAKTLNSVGSCINWIPTDKHPCPKKIKRAISKADALLVIDHVSGQDLISETSDFIQPTTLSSTNPSISVIHMCGGADRNALLNAGIHCFPGSFSSIGSMSLTTDYLGPKPLIDLHTAGLKVGTLMFRAKKNMNSAFEAEIHVLNSSDLAQGFQGYHF